MATRHEPKKQPARPPGDYDEEKVELESDPSPDEGDVGADDADAPVKSN